MRYLSTYQHYIVNENSKNDAIKEITQEGKLGIILIGSPGIGKCLEYTTPILINDKLIEIGKLVEDNIPVNKTGEISIPVTNLFVNSINDDGKLVKNEVSNLYRGYSNDLINIKTQTGIDIKVTKTHPLLVLSNNGDIIWKNSEDIILTDKISRPRYINNTLIKSIEITEITTEMSRIIGYGLSDGDFSNTKNSKYFNLTSIDNDIVDDFKKCIEKESDNILTVKSKNVKHSVQFNDNVKKGHRFMDKSKYSFISKIGEICGNYIFGKKSYLVEIPEIIFTNDELLKNFLACYFVCDGSVYKNRVEYYTSSNKMAIDISYSLLKFGINSVIKNRVIKLNGKEFNSKIIRITGNDYNLFGSIFNEFISCKRKIIKINNNIINPNIGGFLPNDYFVKLVKENKLVKKVEKEIGYKFYENLKFRRVLTKDRFNKIISFLEKENILINEKYINLHNNLFFDKIEEIKILEHNDYVYDIVLCKYHNFIGGNIPTILHNSTFAKNYITDKNRNIKIFSTDDVSLTMSKNPNIYHKGSSELNLRKLSMFIKSGGSFIYDTTGVKKENVESVTKEARDNGYNVVYIHLVGTLDLSLKQNLQRERNVPEDVIKNIYAEQFKNMKYFSSLNPDTYYVVYNIDGKYKYMKYDGQKLIKRKVDRYVESVDNKEFTIKDAYLSAIAVIDDGFLINFYDQDERYLSTDDIDKETDKYKNFKLSKDIYNNRYSRFTLEVTNSKTSLSFEDFATIINDMTVAIEDISSKGWTLADFYASKDDDSAGEHRFYHIRFLFTKPKVKIDDKSLQSAFTKEQIIDIFNSDSLDVEDITFYDDYIEVEFEDNGGNYSSIDDKLNSVTTRLGGTSYDLVNYDIVKIYFEDQE
jgi:intein/homing endonuclease/predicted kinase